MWDSNGVKPFNVDNHIERCQHDLYDLVTRDVLPTGLWPQPDAQLGNRETARSLAQRLPGVEEQAVKEGFTPEALVLTKAIFKVWSRYAELRTVAWPLQPESRWLFSQFTSNDNEQVLALGQIEVEQQVTGADVARLADELVAADGGTMVGWSLLTESLVKTMERDVTRVVLPMAVALVVLLGLAYRDVRGIVLSFATLGFMMICLFAAMSVFGWSWNLMNITALPLLLGAGVDYSIHIQLALKRYGGDIRKVKRSVGYECECVNNKCCDCLLCRALQSKSQFEFAHSPSYSASV